MSETVVGVIGLGTMGGSFAARLREAGTSVVGFDIAENARTAAAEQHIDVAESSDDLARRVDVVITSLPKTDIVEQALFSDTGIVRADERRFRAIIEMSTINPHAWRRMANAARGEGIECLDAPVTGGPAEARAGTLRAFVGGDPAVLVTWRHVLAPLGEILHVGPVGCGHVVKAVNNLMSMANIAVAAEGMALGVSAGMDPTTLFEALSEAGGRSHHFLKRFPWVLEGDLNPRFSVSMGLKDLGIAEELAGESSVELLVTPAARRVYQDAVDSGHGQLDIAGVVRLYEERTGISVSRKPRPATTPDQS